MIRTIKYISLILISLLSFSCVHYSVRRVPRKIENADCHMITVDVALFSYTSYQRQVKFLKHKSEMMECDKLIEVEFLENLARAVCVKYRK